MVNILVDYHGEQVSVPKEVADFLEQDRRREETAARQDRRHLSKSEFETVSSCCGAVRRPTEDAALRNLRLEKLRAAVAELDEQEQRLISLRYEDDLTLKEIGRLMDISKMAVSKRLKKLHERLKGSVI